MSTHIESRTEFVVRNLLKATAKRWPEIAEKSGVPLKTLNKIAYGSTKDPRTSTTDALVHYFQQLEKSAPRRRASDPR